jgi:hypothetical protein
MTRSTLRPVSCASQGRVAADRVAGILLGVEPPTVSLATGSSAGADAAEDAARFARRERIRLARHLMARRRTRIIVRPGL